MRIFRELDYLLLTTTLLMVLLGVTMIYSAAYHSDSATVQTAWDRQAKFAFLALAVALAVARIPHAMVDDIFRFDCREEDWMGGSQRNPHPSLWLWAH